MATSKSDLLGASSLTHAEAPDAILRHLIDTYTRAHLKQPSCPIESWAHIIDPGNPLDRRPNTFSLRYGDPELKNFLDFYGKF